MRDLLYLTHRIPYPPNKGDKIRAYHVLRFLAQHYRVHLGTFVDDHADLKHAATLAPWCATLHLVPIRPWWQQLTSVGALVSGLPLSIAYYRQRSMHVWVQRTLDTYPISQALAFSGATAQFLPARTRHGPLQRVLDLVDMDSEKWRQYASAGYPPASWIYRREALLLREFEIDMARRLDKLLFVSPAEAQLFRQYAPALAHKVDYFCNGVDSVYFRPDATLGNPYAGGPVLVFTGAMDYRPNIDAASWFAAKVMPALLQRFPTLQLHLVGARPVRQIRQLARAPAIHVSGTVADIRPYLQHATLVVAPLRIARGIQNKVLEAMSMAKTVIATPQALEGIQLHTGREALLAADAEQFVTLISQQLAQPEHHCWPARQRVLEDYRWESNLARLGQLLQVPLPNGRSAEAV